MGGNLKLGRWGAHKGGIGIQRGQGKSVADIW